VTFVGIVRFAVVVSALGFAAAGPVGEPASTLALALAWQTRDQSRSFNVITVGYLACNRK
jgi:hypothetical protein